MSGIQTKPWFVEVVDKYPLESRELINHSNKVRRLSAVLGAGLGFSKDNLYVLVKGAKLHDLGKLRYPEMFLLKKGKFSASEQGEKNRHAYAGAIAIVKEPSLYRVEAESACPVALVVDKHHDHYNESLGSYLKATQQGEFSCADEFPLHGARVVKVADCFVAMSTRRSYHASPRTPWQALDEIQKNAGTEFDPVVADCLERVLKSNPELLKKFVSCRSRFV